MSDDKTDQPLKPDDVPAAPVPAVPAPSRAGQVAVLLSLLALGVSVSAPWWTPLVRPETTGPDVQADMTALRTKLDSISMSPAAPVDLTPLQARLDALETRLQAQPAARDPHMGEQIEAIQVTQDQLVQRLGDVDALRQTVSRLEKDIGSSASQSTAEKTLLAASLQLNAAWQDGKPFDAPWLTVLAAASASDPDLAAQLNDMAPAILPWRDRGIPSLMKLTADFAPAARAAVASTVPESAGWWQRTQQRMESLVTVRRQGTALPAEDVAVDAVLARAEAALQAGDLSAAVEEVEKLEDPSASAMGDWLDGARARLAAQGLGSLLAEKAAGTLESVHVSSPVDEGTP